MSESRRFFVPGRLEVLGKHTDYCGGQSLVAALDRGFEVESRPNAGDEVIVEDLATGERVSFPFREDLEPTAGHWSLYPMTVVQRTARDFPTCRQGVHIEFRSNLPPAAGMSSSSALMIATWLSIDAWNPIRDDERFREHLDSDDRRAEYLACVENGAAFGPFEADGGVGTQGGSEDHAAILLAAENTLLQCSFRPFQVTRNERLADDLIFAIASSGVSAEKTGAAAAKYNRCSQLAKAIVEIWNVDHHQEVDCLRGALDSSIETPDEIKYALERTAHPEFSLGDLLGRLEQFYEENYLIIPSATAALQSRDYESFGRLVDRSQELAIQKLQNQISETIALAESARKLGALAASAFGAGFSGSVWALVRRAEADDFLDAWRQHYTECFPERADDAELFHSRPSSCAHEID